jgi:cell division septation protein DedD
VTFARSQATRFQFGASYAANAFLTLRSGIDNMLSAPDNSRTPVTAGFGVHVGGMTLDYAYAPQEYFASTHTVSFTYAFERGARRSSPGPKAGRAGSVVEPARQASAGIYDRRKPVSQPVESKPRNTVPDAPSAPVKPAAKVAYLVIAGVHSRLESARAEARALQLLKVPTEIVSSAGRHRVVIGRYESREKAEAAVENFRKKGHVFNIVTE